MKHLRLHIGVIFFAISVCLLNQQSHAQTGNVGIGTTTPLARLHVADSNVVFTGPLFASSPVVSDPPISGAGSRMMWYPAKGAFRTGGVAITGGSDATEWNKDNIGFYSFASGFNTKAKGTFSTSMGQGTTASGIWSTSMGTETTASGFASTSMGKQTIASGDSSTSMGCGTIASGIGSTSMGGRTIANNFYATSMGYLTSATGVNSTSMGFQTYAGGYSSASMGGQSAAFGDFSVSMGNKDTSFGTASVTMGNENYSNAYACLSIGQFNERNISGNRNLWVDVDPVFVIGNGISSVSRRNALTVLKNGNMGLGTSTPSLSSGGAGLHLQNNATTQLRLQSTISNVGIELKSLSGNLLELGASNSSEFFVYDRTANLSRLLINSAGNVGVGTITPAEKMEVIAGSGTCRLVIGSRSAFGAAALDFVSDYGLANKWRPGYISSGDASSFTGKLEFYTNGTGAANKNGSVKGLEVRNGVAYTATGAVSSFSDGRLKKNVKDFSDGLNVIDQIQPVSFQYNADAPFPTDQTQVGVVAQDLEKAAPYMVHQTEHNGMNDIRYVDNQAYTFLLINAVKELKKQNEELQKQNEVFQKQNESLLRRVEKLEGK
jgi:hypothetical protein